MKKKSLLWKSKWNVGNWFHKLDPLTYETIKPVEYISYSKDDLFIRLCPDKLNEPFYPGQSFIYLHIKTGLFCRQWNNDVVQV